MRLRADGVTGDVAIYSGSDDLPLSDPLGNLSRVRFHSDLEYVAVISTVSGTLNLPGRPPSTEFHQEAHTLFAHGRPGFPLVFGRITGLRESGAIIPIPGSPVLSGSVPVQFNDYGFGRFVILGADATNVVLHETTATGWSLSDVDLVGFNAANNFLPISISYEIYITDTLL